MSLKVDISGSLRYTLPMALHDNLQILGLSAKENKVLLALRDGADTPVKMARQTSVSRSAVYKILKQLQKRGIAVLRITDGHKHWELENEHDLDRSVYDVKRSLLKIPEGSEAIHGRADSSVIVHRGREAVRTLILNLFKDSKGEKFYWGFHGLESVQGWSNLFKTEEVNKVNHLITEGVMPDGWFESETRRLGVGWAKDFEGRTARVNVADPKYFRHGGQCWIFKDVIYLLSLTEELVIEIRNSELQKMLLSSFEFMQDNSRLIDVNELLRNLIAESEKEKAKA
jgi:biotin operon repressor